jgi:uncharacterized membrane protein YccC
MAVTESTQQPREAWSEVGRQFEELGRALRGHFGREPEPAAEDEAEAEAASATSGGAGDRAAMRNALRRLGQAAQQLGEQAGQAVHDPVVRETAQRAGRTLADALDATITELGEDLRGRMRARRGAEPEAPDTGTQQPPPTKEIGGVEP